MPCPAPSVGNLSRPFHSSPSVSFFEKWALMTSTWEADWVQEFPENSPRQAWLTPMLTEAHSILLLLHGIDRAQAEGKFLASGNTYWLGNRRCGLRSHY